MQEKGRLVLGRYCGESIIIDDNVEVTVKSVDKNGLVRLEVEAPKEIGVDRREIWEDKQRDKK
jgi:carbon storage regulator